MFQYFVFCIIIGATFVDCSNGSALHGRIIGGKPVDIEKYPHQASLVISTTNNKRKLCGGSIIGDGSFILTAAHCVKDVKPENIKVRVGSSLINTGGQKMNVKKFIADDENDIAILKLTTKIKVNSKAKPIKLNTIEIKTGSSATVTGWGNTAENGVVSKQLQAVSVKIFSKKDCVKAYGSKITDTMICAGVIGGGKDSCQGDSGGPLIVNGVLVGIVSWGKGCGRSKYPGVYVKVSEVATWITKEADKLN